MREERVTLGDVTMPRREKGAPSDHPELPFIGLEHIEAHTMRLLGTVPAGTMRSNANRFYAGDVLYGRLRPYLNKVFVPSFDGYCSAEFIVFPKSEWIDSSFLKFRLNARDFVSFASHLNAGDRPRVDFDQLSSFAFFLPSSLPAQRAIVAKIEELFSELDKGIENLKTARAQLKVYRQALLKHAFEGKLTAQWRAENQEKLETADALLKCIQQERTQRYQQQLADWEKSSSAPSQALPLLQRGKTSSAAASVPHFEKGGRGGICRGTSKPKAPNPLPPLTAEELAELPELPEGWVWVKLGDLASKITDGEHFKPPVKAEGVYFLSAKDVKHDGVSFDAPLFIDEETAEKARSRCDPERNDILIVSRGATVGRMCIVNTDERFCLLGSVILLKVTAVVQSRYFLSALKSPFVNKKIVGVSGATAQQAIYLRDIQHIPVPVCSSLEQSKIVDELESKLSEADQLDQTLTASLQQAEALRQSILKKAFSGQLVPQDPHDEPASKLLARIKAERTSDGKRETIPRRTKKVSA